MTYVAHFDRPGDLDTWEVTVLGDSRVEGSQLIVSAGAGERAIVGPSSTFSNDLDVSVLARRVAGGDDLTYGLRFHSGDGGSYELSVTAGSFQLLRENEDGSVVEVIPLSQRAEPGGDIASELRAVIRGVAVSVYVDGKLAGRGLDAGPRTGKVRVFVDGPGSVMFDELWVNTALPLL